MFKIIRARLEQGHRTMVYPDAPPPALPARFRGLPIFDAAKCPQGCAECADACPTDAIKIDANKTGGMKAGAVNVGGQPSVDLGRCLFCTDCLNSCPTGAVQYSGDYRLAARRREDLVIDPQKQLKLAAALDEKLMKLFGRSLKLRVVSAGGCNGCESDVNVLNTIGWDLGRFGIQIVASPRHADGLLITGPVTQNMKQALKITYDAVPDPKIVIAVGACAISGGPYIDHAETNNGADSVVPVDLYIPGCPPHPLTILDGLLRLLGKFEPFPSH